MKQQQVIEYDTIGVESDEDNTTMGLVCSIYQNERERELNKPRKPVLRNQDLEDDMVRYRNKIEGKYSKSTW